MQSNIKCCPYEGIFTKLPYGLAVRIPGFHPGGPGSTPGMGTSFFNFFFLLLLFFINLFPLWIVLWVVIR